MSILTRVEEEVRLQAGRSPSGIAHIVMAWIAAVFMVGIILIKMLPFMVYGILEPFEQERNPLIHGSQKAAIRR